MSDARAAYREGFDRFVQGDLEAAIAAYRRAIELDDELALAWNGLSLALARGGDLDGAIDAGRRLVELEPDDALSHTSLSRLYAEKGMIPEAEEERAIAARLSMRGGGS